MIMWQFVHPYVWFQSHPTKLVCLGPWKMPNFLGCASLLWISPFRLWPLPCANCRLTHSYVSWRVFQPVECNKQFVRSCTTVWGSHNGVTCVSKDCSALICSSDIAPHARRHECPQDILQFYSPGPKSRRLKAQSELKNMTFSDSWDPMVKTVTCRPLSLKVWVRPWVNPRGICGRQSGSGTGFEYVSLPQAVSFRRCSTLILSVLPTPYGFNNV